MRSSAARPGGNDRARFYGGGNAPAVAAAIWASRCLAFSWRAMRTPAAITNTVTVLTISVANALISGVTPSRTLEKIIIGNVLVDGPAAKLAMTRSSSDSV